MIYLLAVSLIWAFSFGLIKGQLTGLDSNFVACVRMFISFILFAPLIRLKGIDRRAALALIVTGTCQYGVMYITYIYSYQFLQAYQVALFTIFTPIYVTFINDYFNHRFSKLNLITAGLAVIGAGIVIYQNLFHSDLLFGFLMMQVSNICFAFGQMYYRQVMAKYPRISDRNIFGLLYLGAFLITALAAGITTDFSALSIGAPQILTLLYLGVLASGVCFFLWNYGARLVEGGTLAIFNNLKAPLAVAVSILLFHESGNIPRLLIGGAVVIVALLINELNSTLRS